jgi:hypothetical protein
MNKFPRNAFLAAGLGLGASLCYFAYATAPDDGGEPPPSDKGFCHNIGGPRDLGANCDGTGTCSYTLDTGATIEVEEGTFLGILIPPTSAGALAAHIAHGDGPVLVTFDPPLHLASTSGPHTASNVECLGERVLPQPPEPGN